MGAMPDFGCSVTEVRDSGPKGVGFMALGLKPSPPLSLNTRHILYEVGFVLLLLVSLYKVPF